MAHDVIILGAGAAGLMCAGVAGQRGRRVLLLDHADTPGRKILISGGGRCNFTNTATQASRFLSRNPHFCISALERYTPADFIALVQAHGIVFHEKAPGQLFCDGSARQIVRMLLDECPPCVTLRTGTRVTEVTHRDGLYHVATQAGAFSAPSLVLATGGLSIPKLGATGFAFDLARQFGLAVIPPRPALVPLTLGATDAAFLALAGVSLPVRARLGRITFEDAALFTHRGLSGPAILQISSYWQQGDMLALDLLQDDRAADVLLALKRTAPHSTLRTALALRLPARLAQVVDDQLALPGALGGIGDRALRAAGDRLNAWSFCPSGTEGYAKAEVTAGGIDTTGLSSRTMEARAVHGLFVIGEAVDVTGWLGGYNFQWAWASGAAAGTAV